MSDPTYESRTRIERLIQSLPYQEWRQEARRLQREYCTFFSPMPKISTNVCESCHNSPNCQNYKELELEKLSE